MTNLPLLPFQKQVGQLLHQGKNVILQAPTGAGKTHAAIRPFLYGLEKTRPFPHKCIYAVPMRVLANQFLQDYRDAVSERVVRQALVNQRHAQMPYVDIQTGERRGDPCFEAILTFATIDQVLSSFLIAPYSLPTRQANLNAGAIAASYLIFDEFHLLDPDSTLPTTLEMLRMLKGVTPFLLMTATFSPALLDNLAELLNAEVVGGTPEEQAAFAALPSQQKIRRYHTVDDPLTAGQVVDMHRGRSLVVCNQVERAQALYQGIRAAAPADVEVLLLHSRFLAEDRARIEKQIREKFGKDDNGSGSLIVVATQAIEVGLDINSTVLHTELAPANAIIQRAGRCARYQKTDGDIYVYRHTYKNGEVVDLAEDILPYQGQAETIRLTWEAFVGQQGTLNYVDEQNILDHAHRDQDAQMCEALRGGRLNHRMDMFQVMAGQGGQVRRLVREINQQRVIIHNDPDRLLERVRSPYTLKGFGLQLGTVQGYARDWLGDRLLDEEPPFRVKCLFSVEDQEQSNQPLYQWIAVSDPKPLLGAPIIVVHPTLAGYDKALGFLPDQGNGWMLPDAAPAEEEARETEGFGYRLETYEEHIFLVYGQFQDVIWPELALSAARLERKFGWPTDSLYKAARLAVLLHDTGKLNVEWQRWVVEWQREIGLVDKLTPGEAYAHTDNHTREHWEKAKAFRLKRSPHAVQSAAAVLPILIDHLKDVRDLLCAAFSAISRHHAPHSSEFQPFQLEPEAAQRTLRILQRHAPELNVKAVIFLDTAIQRKLAGEGIGDVLIAPKPDEEAAFLAYILIARALRRADQRGTGMGTQK